MGNFIKQWAEAAYTSTGFFRMALWAFILGNIPLTVLLFGKGVSFAGVMAFIFSDLVVFHVLRINAKYYGWKKSMFIVFLLFTALIGGALILHYSFDLLNILPDPSQVKIQDSDYFKIDDTFFLNMTFLAFSGVLIYLGFFKRREVKQRKELAPKSDLLENMLRYAALICFVWIVGGLALNFLIL